MNFKEFLLTENKSDLGEKLGYILNSIENLAQDIDKQGTKLNVFAEDIVSRVKGILRSDWPSELKQYLIQIRNAITIVCKSLDGSNKMPLPDALKSFSEELKKIAQSLGSPINDIASPSTKKPEESPLSASENKAVVPQSTKINQPTSPGGPPPEPDIPLGGSTGALKNF